MLETAVMPDMCGSRLTCPPAWRILRPSVPIPAREVPPSMRSHSTPAGDVRPQDTGAPATESTPRPEPATEPAARPRRRRLAKRVRRWLGTRLMDLAVLTLPRLYLAYMGLVEVTSRHDERLLRRLLLGCVERHDRAIAVLWHQEVFTVAYNYRTYRGHTLASVSDFGRLITALLERCNFVVARGGSGSRSRRRAVLPALIEHMQQSRRVIYGLTVDGSQGPAYRMKRGAPLIARDCHAPVVAVRTWYSRGFTLPTWDRTQIPLPFTRRLTLASGPYWIAPDADENALEAFRAHLESELLELTERAYALLGTPRDGGSRWGFPAGWTSRWPAGAIGRKFGPWDLDLDHPPPWAHRAPHGRAGDAASTPAGSTR